MGRQRETNMETAAATHGVECVLVFGREGCSVVGEVFPLNEIRSWAKVVNEWECNGAE